MATPVPRSSFDVRPTEPRTLGARLRSFGKGLGALALLAGICVGPLVAILLIAVAPGWLVGVIAVSVLCWLIGSRLDDAEKRSRDTLAELRAIRARLDACPPAPPPPPSYRWDYRTGDWRPMPEGDG